MLNGGGGCLGFAVPPLVGVEFIGGRVTFPPYFALRSARLCREFHFATGNHVRGRGESSNLFISAAAPATILDTEGGDRNLARTRWQDQIDDQHAILLATFYDVARLHEDLFAGNILNREFINRARFAHDYFSLHQGFLQRYESLPLDFVFPINQEHRHVSLLD